MIFKISYLFVLSAFLISCSTGAGNALQLSTEIPAPPSLLLVPGQLEAPRSIRSIQLFRKGNPANPPVIRLGSGNRLVLRFDELTSQIGQFTVRFSHYNKDWAPSGMPDNWVFDGINDASIQGGEKNQRSEPDYFSYQYEFPGNNIKFLVSGNYQVHIIDFQSGVELFSLPFFVVEDAGDLIVRSETIFNAGENGEAADQLFGEYTRPDFVEFPQFDLSFRFIQNRFWGNAKSPGQFSVTQTSNAQFNLTKENSFLANFDFSTLDISEFTTQKYKIYEYRPAPVPPVIVLRDDYLNFTSDPKPVYNPELGFPEFGPEARYAEVLFRFNTAGNLTRDASIHLLGDFNQWTISDRNRLSYNTELGAFETSSIIKEGIYSYKYVVLEEGEIDALRLSDSLTKQEQEYITFVYFKDPNYQYDRILQINLLNSR